MKTYDQIASDLRAGRYQPVYFLYGEEPYYIDKVSDFIEHNVLDEMDRAFDQQVLYGRDITDIGTEHRQLLAAKERLREGEKLQQIEK